MSESGQEFARVGVEKLKFGGTRDIRESVVDELEERIKATGYSPDKPMRVVRENGHFNVGNGNHRLESLHRQDFDGTIPCVIEPEGTDIDEIALESNRDDTTFAEWDLFDYLDTIERKREDNTQAEIAEFLTDGDEEWSRSSVKQHVAVIDKVGTGILETARGHQKGWVPEDGTSVPIFEFTERWFRDSGLYDLADAPYFQQWFMAWFVLEKNCKPGKQQVASKIESLCDIRDQIDTLDSELNAGVDGHEATALESAVLRGEYTDESLRDAIESANEGAKDRTYFGHDAVGKLAEFDDNKFACVVTDMPYGVEYESHHDTDRPDFGIGESDALELLYDVLEECERVCKANAHLYVFFPTKLYHEVRQVIEEFFDIEPVPLVWAKNNIAPTQDTKDGFKNMYAHKHETLFHFRAENGDTRPLNGDSSPNLLEYDIPKGDDSRWHDSQKPIGLWKELITNSTGTGETVLDPFAGSGSSLLAAKQTGRHYVGVEQNDGYESRFKKELRKIESGAENENGDGGDSNE